MAREPSYRGGSPPVPLTSGMWLEAGPSACTLAGHHPPGHDELWLAIDHFHACAMACIRDGLASEADRESQRLVRRDALTTALTFELFERLSAVIVRRADHGRAEAFSEEPLLSACRAVADAIQAPVVRPQGAIPYGFAGVMEIARASRLRVRRTLLRGEWWKRDVGPLVAWHGEERNPVALVQVPRHGYLMIDSVTGTRHRVDPAIAVQLFPEAMTFYPALPSRALGFRDLLAFSLRHASGNVARAIVAVLMLGLLSWVFPLITQALVDSVIPRTELDQLTFCAVALAVTALGMAGVQVMQGVAMLRLEGTIDWKLQAAVIDRLLRLPAAVFREYTVGDFVDRSLGIDAVRRIFTGRTLRSLMAGLFCWFSILLMFYYDAALALIAVGLTILRGLLIVGASAMRLYHENRHFNLQGKVGGLVLQLLAGIGKLRVAAATIRALALWSKQFAAQKRHFIASQRAANALAVVESAFPTLATLVIFAAASASGSRLALDLGAFLAFLTAFGQSMASIGAWAMGMSESLIAIPHLRRIRPLIAGEAEVSDDRKPPGELSGAVELSRVTFRYMSSGPPVLDNVSLRIAPGEYVAIVGPSGSGKSSLFRLLLGFEKPESGAVFFDGKALDTLDVSAVRRQLGVVLQNGRLTTGSLYENICGGVLLPLEQVWDAARLAGLESDIKAMPMGMHTVVAEGVNTLSGGQRQRVMIARAVARRPRILLFDEATSSLDNQSQAIVNASLGALNVTRIVIAHRLSTVREADRIVVLVEGKIVQTGTFAELSGAPGMFADFARRQLL
jgi:NHLM bacteriocin system ABC transporter ATP-binding protein